MIEAGPNGFLNREPQTLALIESARADVAAGRGAARGQATLHRARWPAAPGARRPGNAGDLAGAVVARQAAPARRAVRRAGRRPARNRSTTSRPAGSGRKSRTCSSTPPSAASRRATAGGCRSSAVSAGWWRWSATHGSLAARDVRQAARRRAAHAIEAAEFRPGAGRADFGTGRAGSARRSAPGRRCARWPVATARWQLATAAGELIAADHVVLAVPARQAAPIVEPLDGALSAALTTFEYAGLVVIALAYRAADVPRPLDGYGYLTTRPEGLATLGVAWESSLFPRRSPEGMVLLRVMLGGSRRPDLVAAPASETVAVARAELQTVLGITRRPGARRRARLAAARSRSTRSGTGSAARASTPSRRGIRGCGCAARRTTGCRSTTRSRAGA